ncbi:MAG: TonB family protein [Acidobacteria bacterium]|nr:TonB family protein [Acidobacteriota bacterium]MBS1866100.1 TonB family protein [Acidobacteriota bacterium]
MFEEMVVSSQTSKKTNKPMTVLISTVIQLSLVGILILIPLIYTEALPKAMLSTMLVAPPPPPPPPPPPVAQVVKVRPQVHLMQNNQLVAPKVIPKDVKIIKEEAEPDPNMMGMQGGVPGGVAGGSMGGVLGGVIGGAGGGPPPPKPTQSRIKQGGAVTAASLINRVQPVYPPLARQTRVSGTVRLHAIISKEGTVQQLEVLSGHPLLVQAALDAVRQWRYRPTLLNGEPVEVDTTIDVIFSLNS